MGLPRRLKAHLLGGVLSKAERGELKMPLPVGLVYDQDQKVMFDPDQRFANPEGQERFKVQRYWCPECELIVSILPSERLPYRPLQGPRVEAFFNAQAEFGSGPDPPPGQLEAGCLRRAWTRFQTRVSMLQEAHLGRAPSAYLNIRYAVAFSASKRRNFNWSRRELTDRNNRNRKTLTQPCPSMLRRGDGPNGAAGQPKHSGAQCLETHRSESA